VLLKQIGGRGRAVTEHNCRGEIFRGKLLERVVEFLKP
jgi:hypothetical protein